MAILSTGEKVERRTEKKGRMGRRDEREGGEIGDGESSVWVQDRPGREGVVRYSTKEYVDVGRRRGMECARAREEENQARNGRREMRRRRAVGRRASDWSDGECQGPVVPRLETAVSPRRRKGGMKQE
jgi:hypothetical protein